MIEIFTFSYFTKELLKHRFDCVKEFWRYDILKDFGDNLVPKHNKSKF